MACGSRATDFAAICTSVDVDAVSTELVVQLFDEFLDCDFIHGHGSGRVKVSHLLVEALRVKGHKARVVPCRAHRSVPHAAGEYALGKASLKGPPGRSMRTWFAC